MKKTGIIFLAMLLLSGLTVAQIKYHKGGAAPETTGMVKIPAGIYQPFLKAGNKPEKIKIAAFYLDEHAVTNAEYLAFVKANPEWLRSRVSRLFADRNYLKHWSGDLTIGDKRLLNSPVTNISWFAANAYAKWVGKRLPTMQEWEYAANAVPANWNNRQDLSALILSWYDQPTPDILPEVESTYKNKFGVYDMHGLVWEWVYDFNSVITGSDSRSAGSLDKQFYCAAGSLNAIDKKDYASFMRFAFRESLKAAYTVRTLGFRCAMDVR